MPTDALDPIDALRAAGMAWVDAADAEALAETARITLRAQFTDSMIGSDNPATSKPHSATSAEKAAESTAEYLNAKEHARAATRAQRTAFVDYECAKLRAHAAVRMAEVVA